MPINLQKYSYKELAYFSLFALAAGLAVSNALFSVTLFIFLALSVLSLAVMKDFSKIKNAYGCLLLAYLAVNCLSLFQSNHWTESYAGLLKVLRGAVLSLMVLYAVDSKEKFKKIFCGLLVVAVVIALDGVFQKLTGFDLFRHQETTPYIQGSGGRLTGPFHHANDYAAYLSLVTFLFIGVLPEAGKFFSRKMVLFIYAGFLLVAYNLVQTYSRGAWVAVGAAFIFYALLRRSKVILIILLAGVLWAALFSPPIVKDRFSSILNFKNNTIIERRELWKESFRMIEKKPWFGFGVNTYSKNEPLYKSAEGLRLRVDCQYAHNGYLQMASEIGLVGLASYLTILMYYFVMSLKAFNDKRPSFTKTAGIALMFGVLSFLLHSATDTNLQSFRLVNLLWLALGMGMAAVSLKTQDAS